MLADLRARADSRPSIDHRAFIHICADIDERRHHHDILAYKAATPRNCGRNHAKAAAREVGGSVIDELVRDLVVELHCLHAASADRHRYVIVQAERKQHRLLGPLIDHPFAGCLFRYSQGSVVELLDYMRNCVAHFRRR